MHSGSTCYNYRHLQCMFTRKENQALAGIRKPDDELQCNSGWTRYRSSVGAPWSWEQGMFADRNIMLVVSLDMCQLSYFLYVLYMLGLQWTSGNWVNPSCSHSLCYCSQLDFFRACHRREPSLHPPNNRSQHHYPCGLRYASTDFTFFFSHGLNHVKASDMPCTWMPVLTSWRFFLWPASLLVWTSWSQG